MEQGLIRGWDELEIIQLIPFELFLLFIFVKFGTEGKIEDHWGLTTNVLTTTIKLSSKYSKSFKNYELFYIV